MGMGIRQRGYWLGQAEAIRRQHIAMIAHGVGIGMATDGQEGIDALELSKTVGEIKTQQAEAQWGLMSLLGGGKGV